MASKDTRTLKNALKKAQDRRMKSRVPASFQGSHDLKQYSYSITHDALNPPDQPELPPDARAEYDKAFGLYEKGDYSGAISLYRPLAERYPNAGRIINNLTVCYQRLGMNETVNELVTRNYRENPSYLFAKVDYARLCLSEERFDEIPKIFDRKYDLKELYPHREVFHVQEVAALHSILGLYFARIGKTEAALVYLKSLEKVVPDHHSILQLRLLLMPAMLTKGIKGKRFRDVDMQRAIAELGGG